MICGVSIDAQTSIPTSQYLQAISNAAQQQEVLILYGHKPQRDFSLSLLRTLIDEIHEQEIPFLTASDLLDGAPRAGVFLSFDDAHIQEWYDMTQSWPNETLATFFVTRPHSLKANEVSLLQEMESAGHRVEAHGLNHLDATAFVEEHGLQQWVDEELVPGKTELEALGFNPIAHAYPFGARSTEIDRATLEHFEMVRSLIFYFGRLKGPCG